MRTEVLKEWFFPIEELIHEGSVIPAPVEAVAQRDSLRDGWLREHPRLPKEEPVVSLAPGQKDGQPGYFVRTGIMYLDSR